MQPRPAFALPELLAVAVIVLIAAALVMVMVPSMSTTRRYPRQMQNNTQLRGIHQSMFMYAQGNKGHFPGLNADGTDADLSVENRFQILLDNNYFTGDYAISPAETKTRWTTGPVTASHYSYAMLQVPAAGGRRAEWSETLNTEAAVAGDRNLGTAADPYSVWTSPGSDWRGSVVWNDNHVAFESTHVLRTAYTVPDTTTTPPTMHTRAFPADELFEAASDDDALFIHTGNAP